MSYWGDFPLEETLNFLFTTRAFATGIPSVLAGSPVLSVYEDTNLTQITAGVTITVDHDAVVGLNRANIVATAANGYEAGKTYTVVITTGTVLSVSVVGEVVGTFTINRGAALRPTTAGNTLDVAATGEAGVDFSNINGTLDAAEIGADAITAAKVAAGTIDAATFAAGAIDATAIANGAIDAATFAAGAIDAAAIANGAIDAATFAAGAIDAAAIATDAITAAKIAAGAITSSEAPNLDAAVSTRATQAQVASEMSDALTVDTIAELAQGVPATTPTIVTAIMLLYMALRNKVDVDASFKEIANNAGTVITKKALTDDATTYSEATMVTGP